MYQLPVLERVANLLQKRNPAGSFLCSIHSTHFLPRLNWKWHKPLERSLSSGCRPARDGGQRGSFRPHSPQGFPCGILAPSAPSGHRSRRPRAGQRLAAGSSRRTPHCPHSLPVTPHSPPQPALTARTHCRSRRTHRRRPGAEQGRRCPGAAAPRCPNARYAPSRAGGASAHAPGSPRAAVGRGEAEGDSPRPPVPCPPTAPVCCSELARGSGAAQGGRRSRSGAG